MAFRDVYLDNAASTYVVPNAVRAATHAMTATFGNPSSVHSQGIAAEMLIRETKEFIAASLGVDAAEIYMTSGGTEGNNTALFGAARARRGRGRHIISSQAEHPSVTNVLEALKTEGFEVTYVPVDRAGMVSPDAVAEAIRPDTIVISIVWVNNELGTINPLADIVKRAKAINQDLIVHTDGVQAYGKIPVYPRDIGIDLMTASGHKLHAPKGTGFLYVRRGVTIRPLVYGGGQENGLRSGTENVPGIAGLGAVVQSMLSPKSETAFPRAFDHMTSLRDRLIQSLQTIDRMQINGAENGAPHIIHASFDGIQGEVFVRVLASKGVYVSSGSACSSKKSKESRILRAAGLPKWAIDGSIRVSLSPFTTSDEIDRAADKIKEAVLELRR